MRAIRWSLADTHCVWCGKPLATQHDDERHQAAWQDRGEDCDPDTCWCGSYCWSLLGACEASFTADADRLRELRGLAEAQAAVIARYRAGWAPRERDGVPRWMHDGYLPLKWEPMTDAERQVLYPAGPQPTEGTTP